MTMMPMNPYTMPNYTAPSVNQFQQSTTPNFQSYQTQSNLIRVTGIEGAKAYQMTPNSVVALFDSNDDIMYIKSSDGAGFPTIRTFAFKEVQENAPSTTTDYVTRAEFEELRKEIENGKQSISKASKKPNGNGEK